MNKTKKQKRCETPIRKKKEKEPLGRKGPLLGKALLSLNIWTSSSNMIGETGMVDNFDVSLSSSFVRKKRQQERECGFYIYNPGGAMFWGWSVSGCEIGAMGAVSGVGDAWTVWEVCTGG